MTSLFRRLTCVGVVAIAIVCMTSLPASAHAQLISTNPTADSTVASSPKSIQISFDEAVSISFDSVKLYNNDGVRVVTSKPFQKGNSTVGVKPPTLKNGTYLVSWSFVSADSHPVSGGFSFSVGQPSQNNLNQSDEVSKILSGPDISQAVSRGFAVLRFIIFTCIALVIAVIVARLYVARGSYDRRLNLILYGTLVVLVLSSIASIGFQAALAGHFSLSKAFTPTIFNQELHTRLGFVESARVGLAILLFVTWKYLTESFARIALPVLAIAFAASPGLAGHASAGNHIVLAYLNDVAHVLAAGAWFGGLLILPLLISHEDRDVSIRTAQKFSNVALISVCVIAFTGALAWWRQVGSISASFSTWFGQLINIKIIAFIGVICVAWFSRRHVKLLMQGTSLEKSKKNLIRCVLLESLLLIIIMGVTAVVVSAIPGHDALSLPVTKHVSTKSTLIDVTIDPPKAGAVDVHVYVLKKNGTPYPLSAQVHTFEIQPITVSITNKKKAVGPLPVDMRFIGLNHFVSVGARIPFPGTWTMTIRLKLTPFNEEVTKADVNIR